MEKCQHKFTVLVLTVVRAGVEVAVGLITKNIIFLVVKFDY